MDELVVEPVEELVVRPMEPLATTPPEPLVTTPPEPLVTGPVPLVTGLVVLAFELAPPPPPLQPQAAPRTTRPQSTAWCFFMTTPLSENSTDPRESRARPGPERGGAGRRRAAEIRRAVRSAHGRGVRAAPVT